MILNKCRRYCPSSQLFLRTLLRVGTAKNADESENPAVPPFFSAEEQARRINSSLIASLSAARRDSATLWALPSKAPAAWIGIAISNDVPNALSSSLGPSVPASSLSSGYSPILLLEEYLRQEKHIRRVAFIGSMIRIPVARSTPAGTSSDINYACLREPLLKNSYRHSRDISRD